VRLSRADFSSSCKSFLNIEFASQDITAFGGLELVRRYLALIELGRRVRTVFARYEVGGDYRAIDMILVIVVLILVGGRRLEHLNYICDDPLVKRFCGLLKLPRERSVARWLKRFTHKSVMALVEINSQIVGEAIEKQSLARLTFDIDGSVITTGATVAWAYRGFNPHHRKDPSYYPILAHVAQTGHILRVKNRPGNVHDSKGALAFIRELIDDVRVRLGKSLPLEFRMDGAFFQREIIALLERTKSCCRVPADSEHEISESKMAIDRRLKPPGGSDGQTESMERREALSDRQRSAESKRAGRTNRQTASGLRRIDLPMAG